MIRHFVRSKFFFLCYLPLLVSFWVHLGHEIFFTQRETSESLFVSTTPSRLPTCIFSTSVIMLCPTPSWHDGSQSFLTRDDRQAVGSISLFVFAPGLKTTKTLPCHFSPENKILEALSQVGPRLFPFGTVCLCLLERHTLMQHCECPA
jgi:hypothetical protein